MRAGTRIAAAEICIRLRRDSTARRSVSCAPASSAAANALDRDWSALVYQSRGTRFRSRRLSGRRRIGICRSLHWIRHIECAVDRAACRDSGCAAHIHFEVCTSVQIRTWERLRRLFGHALLTRPSGTSLVSSLPPRADAIPIDARKNGWGIGNVCRHLEPAVSRKLTNTWGTIACLTFVMLSGDLPAQALQAKGEPQTTI